MTSISHFKKLFDASPNAYLIMRPDFVVTDVNDAFLRATKRTRSVLIGHYIFDAFPSDPENPVDASIDRLTESFRKVLSTREADSMTLVPYAIEEDNLDGKAFVKKCWSITNAPLLGDDGKVEFIFQHVVDVTKFDLLKAMLLPAESGYGEIPVTVDELTVFYRMRAEQAASRMADGEREHLKRLFEQAPGFIAFLRGPRHIFELANNAYYQLVGHRPIIGKPVHDALPEVAGQGFFELLDKVYKTGEPFVGHSLPVLIQREPNGGLDQLFVDFVYQPLIEPDGTVSGIFCQGSDVTQQKYAQDKLALQQEQLKKLVEERTSDLEKSQLALQHSQKMESLGKLTGGVAHDFNNVLQIIGGNLQLLRLNFAADPRAEIRLNTAAAAVDRGAKLSSQLLSFARRQPLQPVATNMGSVLRRMDDLLRRALGEAIEIETIVAGGLWATMVDPSQLENVILNIAINARDAMAGTGKLTLELGNATLDDYYAHIQQGVPAGQYVMLAISDTGSGMSPEIMERAFEPFFTTKPEGEGTGLGLSMAYGFVKQSDGHIKLYSEPGNGTTIKIYLPRSHQSEMTIPDVISGPVVGGKETILVVEDDPAVQATVIDMLSGLGYKVLRAKDGESALSVIQSGIPIDLLFTDVVMPGPVRSTDLAKQAQQLLPDIAVLFTSGYTQNAIVHGGRLDAGVELLSKPYRQEDLARKIRHIFARKNNMPAAPIPVVPIPAQPDKPPELTVKGARLLRILVVEDNLDAQQMVCELLMLLGHTAKGVSSAEEAIDVLATTDFDVLFTDVGLPGMSGVELARKATRAKPALKVIFASGYGDVVANTDFYAISLPKPYDFVRLQEVLDRIA